MRIKETKILVKFDMFLVLSTFMLLNDTGKLRTLRHKRCEDAKQVTILQLIDRNIKDSSEQVINNFKVRNLIGQLFEHVINSCHTSKVLVHTIYRLDGL